MSHAMDTNWYEVNQRHLGAALKRVRERLQVSDLILNGDQAQGEEQDADKTHVPVDATALSPPAALDTLCQAFALSPFERDLLLLCAGVELDAELAASCASAQGEGQHTTPTLSLALRVLPEAHWSALTPAAALRRWRMIEVGASSSLLYAPLRIDERILHYLVGISYLDERLQGLIEPLNEDAEIVPSQAVHSGHISRLWLQTEGVDSWPVIHLAGIEAESHRAIARAVGESLQIPMYVLHGADIPVAAAECAALSRLWEREVLLSGSALLVDAGEPCSAEQGRAIERFIDSTRAPLLVASNKPVKLSGHNVVRLDIAAPTRREQEEIWRHALGPVANKLNGQLSELVMQFNLDNAAIQTVSSDLRAELSFDSTENATQRLWQACRRQARQNLEGLAERIVPMAGWDDLVLPTRQRKILAEIAAQVRQRAQVYDQWGFAQKSNRGLGISALFSGRSGTGKTMAAEVLANELDLDLFRIDLSQVVSKYIGETEKNLRRVFDVAEQSGAILLFDEADALFGKRSEIKDSHDRYANIEVSYLLQRMEAYKGLAILTSNLQDSLDTAFQRRLRFIVQFPFPDAAQRAEIWRRIFPADTPTQALDVTKLARLNITGGNIRNIALNAAFLAADSQSSVSMEYLLHAARSEYAKLDKSISGSEIRGWT